MPPESARHALREASRELARLRRIRGASHRTWRRIARARRRLACAAALLAAAPLGQPAAAVVPVFRHGFVFPDSVSGEGNHHPTFADIDGDGDLDAFVSGSSGRTHFFANAGSALHPAFAAHVTNPFGLFDIGSDSFTSFGDIDGDGDLDAFVGHLTGILSFFRNTGTAAAPAFGQRAFNPFGLADVGDHAAPVPIDIDGDGDLDVAIGNYNGDTLFFVNTGTAAAPAFAPPLTNPFGLARMGIAARPSFADLDADGDLDAFIGWHHFQSADRLHWFENTGSATSPAFAPPVAHPFGLLRVGGPTSVTFGDVDFDGDLDALLSGGPSLMVPLENTGTASAPAFAIVANPFDLTLAGSPTSNVVETAPAFADIDADGDLDAFIASSMISSALVFSRNVGAPSLPLFAPDPANPWGLVGSDPTLADIDADGDADAFVGNAAGDILFHENTGGSDTPAFAAALTNPFGLTGVGLYASPAFADIDGDGDLDAVVGHALGDTVSFQNTGSAAAPAFAAGSVNPFGLVPVGFGASPDFGDFDADGDLDGLFGHAAGNLLLFENTGSVSAPTFAAPVTNPSTLYDIGARTAPQLVDLDGDGDLDLFVGRAEQGTALFVNVGAPGAPFFHGAYSNRFGNDGVNTAPALWDLDGDGDLDALVGRTEPNLLLLRNFGTLTTPRFVAADAINPFGLREGRPQLVDIDGDGDLDAFHGRQDGLTLFLENVGSPSEASFAFAVSSPFGLVDVGARAMPAFGDVDDDGDLDAAIGNSTGAILWFTNTGTAASPAFAPPTTNPFGLAGVGQSAAPVLVDVDGDGDLDALVGNSVGDTHFFANTGTAGAPAFAAPSVNPFGLVRIGRDAVPSFVDVDGDGDLDGFLGDRRGRVIFFENLVIDPDACSDGLDNDGDGRIDLGDDPGCASAADTSELGTTQCDNGLDDDGDGFVDAADPHCTGPLDDREAPTQASPGCGLGPELVLLVPFLAALRGRRTRA